MYRERTYAERDYKTVLETMLKRVTLYVAPKFYQIIYLLCPSRIIREPCAS